MKEADIKRCKVGDRVRFKPLIRDAGDACDGTITAKRGTEVDIAWDDGETCTVVPYDYTRITLLETGK